MTAVESVAREPRAPAPIPLPCIQVGRAHLLTLSIDRVLISSAPSPCHSVLATWLSECNDTADVGLDSSRNFRNALSQHKYVLASSHHSCAQQA